MKNLSEQMHLNLSTLDSYTVKETEDSYDSCLEVMSLNESALNKNKNILEIELDALYSSQMEISEILDTILMQQQSMINELQLHTEPYHRSEVIYSLDTLGGTLEQESMYLKDGLTSRYLSDTHKTLSRENPNLKFVKTKQQPEDILDKLESQALALNIEVELLMNSLSD